MFIENEQRFFYFSVRYNKCQGGVKLKNYAYSVKVNDFQDTLQGQQTASNLIAASQRIKEKYALEYDVTPEQVEILDIAEIEQLNYENEMVQAQMLVDTRSEYNT